MTNRSRAWLNSLLVLALLWLGRVPSCTDECSVTKTGNPSSRCGGEALPMSDAIMPIAKLCGLDVSCSGPGLGAGNAAISGVQSIDTYFASVLRFETEADRVSAALGRELAAIRAGFGIEAGVDLAAAMRARIAADVEGELRVRAGTPSCEIATDAVLDASRRCEGAAASAEVGCLGRCELRPDGALGCAGEAKLACTFLAAATRCAQACKGSCTTDQPTPRECSGVCRGSCSGPCSLYSDAAATQCAGHCDGTCTGSCEVELPSAAACDGVCSGECTLASSNGRCDGASSASCEAAQADTVACSGRCVGGVVLARTSAECKAAVEAEAKMNAQCSPPSVTVDYKLRSDLDAETGAQLEFGMQMLRQRLPLLLMALARAQQTAGAGADLAANASSVVAAARLAGREPGLDVQFRLRCALSEAARIPDELAPASTRLDASVREAMAVTAEVGLQ
jgi:hypothetical protein